MSNPEKPAWSDMTTDDQDEAILEALISGKSPFSLVQAFEGLKHRALTRRMASPEFLAKAQPAREEAVAAARLSAAFLSASMLTSGVAGKDGIAYKELKLLLDRQKDIQGEAPAASENDDEKTAQALKVVESQRWKLQNPKTTTPEA